MTKLGEFQLERIDDDWNLWAVNLDGERIMTVAADVARGIMTRKYDPKALARGELVPADSAREKERQG